MGLQFRLCGAVLALTALFAQAANAQDDSKDKTVVLPTINVGSSRLGTGIVGSSTSIITSEDI